MIREVIKSCLITKSDSQILKPWIDNKESDDFEYYNELHSGIDLATNLVYTMSSGVVLQVGKSKTGKYAVTIQYDVSTSLRYMNLTSVNMSEGDIVKLGDIVGRCREFVHFEYISINKENSIWPVHIGTMTYYKHDPSDIAKGNVKLDGDEEKVIYYDLDPNIQTIF